MPHRIATLPSLAATAVPVMRILFVLAPTAVPNQSVIPHPTVMATTAVPVIQHLRATLPLACAVPNQPVIPHRIAWEDLAPTAVPVIPLRLAPETSWPPTAVLVMPHPFATRL